MENNPITLIACEIFADELQAVLAKNGHDPEIIWLEAALHTDLSRLGAQLEYTLAAGKLVGKRYCLLYGSGCLAGIEAKFGACETLLATNCIEALVGSEKKLKYEAQGCFLLTPGWLRAWPAIMGAMGWDAVDVRTNLGRYEKIVVFDAGINSLTDEELMNFFDLTGLFVEVVSLDLQHFARLIAEIIAKK